MTDLREIDSESVDAVTVRSVLIYASDRTAAFAELRRVLRPGGRLSIFEPLNSFSYPGPEDRWGPWHVGAVQDLADRVKDVFRAVQTSEGASMHDFGAEDMLAWAEDAGFADVVLTVEYFVAPPPAQRWEEVEHRAANPLVPTLGEAIDEALDPDEARRFRAHLREQVESGEGSQRSAHLYLRAVR